MSCYNCTKDFSFFNREHACAKCGFGFCSSCLKHKVLLPNTGTKEQRVCQSCHQLVTRPDTVSKVYAPPEALQKRLDSLSYPGGQPPVTVYRDRIHNLKRGLSKDDQKIVDRLSQLQAERKGVKSVPSEAEVRERLARLKGEFSAAPTNPLPPPDTRADIQRSEDLVKAVAAEVSLDEKHRPVLSPEADIAARLARLRGEPEPAPQVPFNSKEKNLPDPTQFLSSHVGDIEGKSLDEVGALMSSMHKAAEKEAALAVQELEKDKALREQLEKLKARQAEKCDKDSGSDTGSESDGEAATAKLLKQIMAEQELEEKLGFLQVADGDFGSSEPEELPWCVLCNADPSLRCSGCLGDLYCRSCFVEAHKGEDMLEHQTTKFDKK